MSKEQKLPATWASSEWMLKCKMTSCNLGCKVNGSFFSTKKTNLPIFLAIAEAAIEEWRKLFTCNQHWTLKIYFSDETKTDFTLNCFWIIYCKWKLNLRYIKKIPRAIYNRYSNRDMEIIVLESEFSLVCCLCNTCCTYTC